MNVLHVGLSLSDGAGLGMYRLHRDLLNRGVESRILCRWGWSSDPNISLITRESETLEESAFRIETTAKKKVETGLRLRGWLWRNEEPGVLETNAMAVALKEKYGRWTSSPFSPVRVDLMPEVAQADVIHLHWVSGLVDFPTFFSNVGKPVVWTLRDEWPALGFWHYRTDEPEGIENAEKQENERIRRWKAEWIRRCPSLGIVSLSRGEDSFFRSSSAFRKRPHTIVPNSVNEYLFKRNEDKSIRRRYGISDAATVIAFVAQTVNAPRKGLRDLLTAVNELKRPDLVVICVGSGGVPEAFGPRIIDVGPMRDPADISAVLSASDLFVSPSFSETFGKTLTEALACGVPVVSYPNSGAKDIVEPEDGALADAFTPAALARAIDATLSRRFDPERLRARVLSRFSRDSVAKAYESLYQKAIGGFR